MSVYKWKPLQRIFNKVGSNELSNCYQHKSISWRSRHLVLAQTLGFINCFSPRTRYHSSLDLHLGEKFVQTFLTLKLRRFLASESHAAVQQWKWKVIAIRKIDYKLLTFWPKPAFSLTLRTLVHGNFISDVSEILLPISFSTKTNHSSLFLFAREGTFYNPAARNL